MTTGEIILAVLAAIQLAVIAWLTWGRARPFYNPNAPEHREFINSGRFHASTDPVATPTAPPESMVHIRALFTAVLDSADARADRDAGRIDTLLAQCLAISEQNLAWQTTAHVANNPDLGRVAAQPRIAQVFDDEQPGPDGGLGDHTPA